jgi:hypothetical protein
MASDVWIIGISVWSFARLPFGTDLNVKIPSIGRASWVSITVGAEADRVEEDGLALTFTDVSREATLILRYIVVQFEELRKFLPSECLEGPGEKQPGTIAWLSEGAARMRSVARQKPGV